MRETFVALSIKGITANKLSILPFKNRLPDDQWLREFRRLHEIRPDFLSS